MFEDINNSGDGGIYAELLQNRAFQAVEAETEGALLPWVAVGGTTISVINSTAPVSSALPNSLRIAVPANSTDAGIAVDLKSTYQASFYAKSTSKISDLLISLRGLDGTILGSGIPTPDNTSTSAPGTLSADWTQYSVSITPILAPSNINNSMAITFSSPEGGEVFIALASLFPPTWKNRPNGLRIDLMETLASMNPSFFRWPGGNNIEGNTVDTRWKWHETIGPLVSRPGRMGTWGYANTDGLGMMEYLDLCEDLGVEQIMAVYGGYSLGLVPQTATTVFGGVNVLPEDLSFVWQAALDQIQFAIGDPKTNKWAALRAEYGHPAPYNVSIIEIGNEDNYSPATYAAYRWNYIVGNLTAVFPDLSSDGRPGSTAGLVPVPSSIDQHFYTSPEVFYADESRYDLVDRSLINFQIFVGEYASLLQAGTEYRYLQPELSGAIGEAAFMVGLERNSDLIFAASYAPLRTTTNVPPPDMFSVNRGDIILPVLPVRSEPLYYVASKDSKTGDLYIKAVNTAADPITFNVAFDPTVHVIGTTGLATLLSSTNTSVANTLADPDALVPVMSSFIPSSAFNYTIPGNAVLVLAITA
ncbi:hypothetical protein RQP46_005360 [Phenoliferia psychrophenolica]